MKLTEKIIKKKDGYYVQSEDGEKNLGGPYTTEDEAKKRLQQVHYFKNKTKKNEDLTAGYEITRPAIYSKFKKHVDAEYKHAFEVGTDEAWERFYKEVNKMANFWNKKIAEHNKGKKEIDQWDLIDPKQFLQHYDINESFEDWEKHYNHEKLSDNLKDKIVVKEFNLHMTSPHEEDIPGAVLVIPNAYQTLDGYTFDAAIGPIDENGEGVGFSSVKEAQDWLDKHKEEAILTSDRDGLKLRLPELDYLEDEREEVVEDMNDSTLTWKEIYDDVYRQGLNKSEKLERIAELLWRRGYKGKVFDAPEDAIATAMEMEEDMFGWYDPSVDEYDDLVSHLKRMYRVNNKVTEGAEGKREPGFEYVIYDYTDEDDKHCPIVAKRSTKTEAEYIATKWMGNMYGEEGKKKYKDRLLTFERVPKGKFEVGDNFYGPFDSDYNLKEDWGNLTLEEASIESGAKSVFDNLSFFKSELEKIGPEVEIDKRYHYGKYLCIFVGPFEEQDIDEAEEKVIALLENNGIDTKANDFSVYTYQETWTPEKWCYVKILEKRKPKQNKSFGSLEDEVARFEERIKKFARDDDVQYRADWYPRGAFFGNMYGVESKIQPTIYQNKGSTMDSVKFQFNGPKGDWKDKLPALRDKIENSLNSDFASLKDVVNVREGNDFISAQIKKPEDIKDESLVEVLQNKELYMKPTSFIVNNAMSRDVDRMFGDRIKNREVLEKNKIKYTIPYDGDLEYFLNRYKIKRIG